MNSEPKVTKEFKSECEFRAESPYVKELKERLIDLVRFTEKESGYIEYYGGAEADALYKDKDVAIQSIVMEAGREFPIHHHPIEREWIIFVKGKGTIWLDGEEINFKATDYVVIEPGSEHSGHVDEKTWAICISIPADEGYPDVPANND